MGLADGSVPAAERNTESTKILTDVRKATETS